MAHPKCQAEIDARNGALRAVNRATLLRAYAQQREAYYSAPAQQATAAAWREKIRELQVYITNLTPFAQQTQVVLEQCLYQYGGSASGPAGDRPPVNDAEFDSCMSLAPRFDRAWPLP